MAELPTGASDLRASDGRPLCARRILEISG
jgi:hypothetical protein